MCVWVRFELDLLFVLIVVVQQPASFIVGTAVNKPKPQIMNWLWSYIEALSLILHFSLGRYLALSISRECPVPVDLINSLSREQSHDNPWDNSKRTEIFDGGGISYLVMFNGVMWYQEGHLIRKCCWTGEACASASVNIVGMTSEMD